MPAVPVHVFARSADSSALSMSSSLGPVYVAGFVVVGLTIMGLFIWFGIRIFRNRSKAKRDDVRGAAFLSVRGLVKEGDEQKTTEKELPESVMFALYLVVRGEKNLIFFLLQKFSSHSRQHFFSFPNHPFHRPSRQSPHPLPIRHPQRSHRFPQAIRHLPTTLRTWSFLLRPWGRLVLETLLYPQPQLPRPLLILPQLLRKFYR